MQLNYIFAIVLYSWYQLKLRNHKKSILQQSTSNQETLIVLTHIEKSPAIFVSL